MSRRTLLGLLATAGSASLLGACTPVPTAAPTQRAATTPGPRGGGTLQVGVLGDLQNLDGHVTTGLDSLHRIWEPVSLLDDQLNPVPVLAESVALTPDARQMTLALRQGVTFHTGRGLVADDVIWNFNRLKDPKVNPTLANLVKPFVQMAAPDAATVQVQFDAPNPFVVDALPNLLILDPVTFQQAGPNVPVGTGPFTFGEWVQGDHLSLRKNPAYWNPGKPLLDELHFRIFTDPQAMITEFEAGTLDLAIQPSLVDWVRLQKAGSVQALINRNSGNYVGMTFNVQQPPTDSKLFRQALQFSLDRQRIVDTVFLGVEQPLELLWFPTSPAYDPAKNQTYAFDLDRAKALLAQAGVAQPALDFNYPAVASELGQAGQIWQQDLDKIGITLNLKPTEPVALQVSMQQQHYNGVALGTGFYGQLHGGVVWTSPYFGPVNNWSGFKEDAYTQLTLQLYTEADATKRQPLYDAWNRYVLDQSFVTAISTQFPRAVAKPNVAGLGYTIGGNYLDVTGAYFT